MHQLNELPAIGLTMGDAAGIGAEILAKAAQKGELIKDAHPIIFGDLRLLKRGMEIAGADFPYTVVKDIETAVHTEGIVLIDSQRIDAYAVDMGKTSTVCGKEAAEDLRTIVGYSQQGWVEGVCFAPNDKTAIKNAGYPITGMANLLALFYECKGNYGEINIAEGRFNARVISHVPVKDIAASLTTPAIIKTIRLGNSAAQSFGIDIPRVAVAALNPHAGENGTCGTEEIDIILPAIEAVRSEGMNVTGPLAADTVFVQLFNDVYDVVITMYHDQGQIAFKLKDFDNGVTYYSGLPFPATTCAHGTAYGRAGKGRANPGSFIAAYRTVVKMAHVARKRKNESR